MNTKLMTLALELVELGVPVTLRKDKEGALLEFQDGFYKSDGHATVRETSRGLCLFARYEELTEVLTAKDVVSVSYKWWQYSRDRFEGWKVPAVNWLPLYVKFGMEE